MQHKKIILIILSTGIVSFLYSCKSTSSSLGNITTSKSTTKSPPKTTTTTATTPKTPTVVVSPPKNTTTTTTSKADASEMSLRNNIIQEAEKHKGVKYKAAGKDPKGFDCSGFTSYVSAKYNINLSSSSAAQATQGIEIPLDKVQVGDLLVFGPDGRNGRIQHVGFCYKNTKEGVFMIHSSTSRGIVIDNVTTSTYWQPKLLFARRIVDLKK